MDNDYRKIDYRKVNVSIQEFDQLLALFWLQAGNTLREKYNLHLVRKYPIDKINSLVCEVVGPRYEEFLETDPMLYTHLPTQGVLLATGINPKCIMFTTVDGATFKQDKREFLNKIQKSHWTRKDVKWIDFAIDIIGEDYYFTLVPPIGAGLLELKERLLIFLHEFTEDTGEVVAKIQEENNSVIANQDMDRMMRNDEQQLQAGRPSMDRQERIYRLVSAAKAITLKREDPRKTWKVIAREIEWQLGITESGLALLREARKEYKLLEIFDPEKLLPEVRKLLNEKNERNERNY